MKHKFIQPAFIRKNTPELRKKLEELGYEPSSSDNHKGLYLWTDELGLYYSSCNHLSQEYGEYIGPYGIFCKDNEDLFLALAALREDCDYMQFFTNGTHWYICEANRIENSSLFDKEYKVQIKDCSDYHKATAEELIEHFK